MTPTPVGFDDFFLRRIISPNVTGLSPQQAILHEIGAQVRALGDHPDTVRVYIDVIPPGGPSDPGGCLPNGRVLDSTVLLDPIGESKGGIAPKQANLFGDTGTLGDGFVEFSCTSPSNVQGLGLKYTLIAAVDAHGDDSVVCGPGLLLTGACFNALADDDSDFNNRLTRSAPRVQ